MDSNSKAARRLRPLPWRRRRGAGECIGAAPARTACRVSCQRAAGIRRGRAPQRHHAAAGCRPRRAGHQAAGRLLREAGASQAASQTIDKSLVERGQQLATTGDPANGIPACNACHGRDAIANYPRLAGQSAAYMVGQLRLWRAGHHATTRRRRYHGTHRAPSERAGRGGRYSLFREPPCRSAGARSRVIAHRHRLAVLAAAAVCRLRRQPVRARPQGAAGGRACPAQLAAVRVRHCRAPWSWLQLWWCRSEGRSVRRSALASPAPWCGAAWCFPWLR